MINGDVFHWRYKVEEIGAYPYHCKSCIAIAKDGMLIDTFWGTGNEGRVIGGSIDDLELEYLGNLSQFKPVASWELSYYDSKDVLDLRHSNNSSEGNTFIRIGASKSKEQMLKVAEECFEHWEGEEKWAKEKKERSKNAIDILKSNLAFDSIYLCDEWKNR